MSSSVNAKHERFAQALANGRTQFQAHGDAGYKAHAGNACKLAADKKIVERVAEILAEREKMHAEATQMATETAGLSKTWIIERLMRNASVALADEPLKVRVLPRGATTPIEVEMSMHDAAAANRALELLGKELGMFIDRKEIRTGELDALNADDRAKLRDSIERELASRTGGAGSGRPTRPH